MQSMKLMSLKAQSVMGATLGLLVVASSSASGFTFTPDFASSGGAEDDIFLNGVTIGDRFLDISDLSLVSSAQILSNDEFTGGDTGAASTDSGDTVSVPGFAPDEDPSGEEVAAFLGNSNLNSIVDGEDTGAFEIALSFDSSFNSLLIFERGLNSSFGVRVDNTEFVVDSSDFSPAGFAIDTTEIAGAQEVGTFGLDLSEFGPLDEVVVFADASFNGPDFTVVGAKVPEPATVLGLAALAGTLAISRTRRLDDEA